MDALSAVVCGCAVAVVCGCAMAGGAMAVLAGLSGGLLPSALSMR